ncbi:MAG: class I SAM-dependent RNA methyltransferase [Chloroflexi bacterium]|nr:class I SAM-dependent RNA methyltransferase [Chloroflexota bacterium]
MNSTLEYEVTPTVCVYGGDALARLPDGRAVFIPYALPEETIRIRLVEEKERFARGEILEIITPSPLRIPPRCIHFQDCGGCHYQHIAYDEQLKIKQAIFVDQLVRVGKLTDPPVRDIIPSPSAWQYRNQIQFHLSEDGLAGFYKHRSHQVVPIQECHLPEDNLNQIWPAFNFDFIPGLDRISLRSGEEGQDALIVLESSDPQPIEFSVDVALSAVHRGPSGEIVLAGDDFTVMPLLDFPFVVSAGSFFQVNTKMAELIVNFLLETLPLEADSVFLDVYCGVGLFSVFIAPLVASVIGIESDPGAGEDYLYNLAGFDNVEFYDRPAEEVLPFLNQSPDIALVDPPRAGLSRSVLDSLVSLNPDLIVYISCDPATLARDISRFQIQGYSLRESTPFDMFPQTYHIESVNIFQRILNGA